MRAGHVLMVAGSLAVLEGCAHAGRPVAVEPPIPESSVRVAVTNEYGLPVDVFVSGDGAVYRLGTVAPGIVRHFALRAALLAGTGEVRLYARPMGSGPLIRSGRLRPQPGDTIAFEIPSMLSPAVGTLRP